MNMTMKTRWLIAVPVALVALALGAVVYPVGFFLGGMATDSCSNLPGFSLYYLQYFWPAVMLVCALLAPVLILRKFRWRWVFAAAAGGLAASAVAYVLWFVILQFC